MQKIKKQDAAGLKSPRQDSEDSARPARDWMMTSKAGASNVEWPSLRPTETVHRQREAAYTGTGVILSPLIWTKR